jgi:hypothetical protein
MHRGGRNRAPTMHQSRFAWTTTVLRKQRTAQHWNSRDLQLDAPERMAGSEKQGPAIITAPGDVRGLRCCQDSSQVLP